MTERSTGRVALEELGPLGAELGAGGQGTVYALPRSPALVYKQYSAQTLDQVDTGALGRMVELPGTFAAEDRAALLARAAWPLTVVEQAGRVSGFLMARVPPRFRTRVRFPRGYSERLGETQLLLNDKQYLRDRDLAVSDRFRLELLHDVAFTLQLFHRLDVVVGDLSPNNLLFSRTAGPRCFFLDCDAMRVRGGSVLPQIETVDWQVPEPGEPLGTRAGDAYKLTLLCVRLFAGEQNAVDPGAVLRAGRPLHELARRGLSRQARRRPSPAEWRKALAIEKQGVPEPKARPAPRPSRWGAVGGFLTTRLRRTRPRNAVKLAAVTALLLYAVPNAAVVEDWVRATTRTITELAADDGQEQADGVAVLLTASARSRKQVRAAVQDVTQCKRLKPAAAKLGKASADRRAAVGVASRLATDDLTGGAELRAQLVTAFRHSQAADEAYRRWAQALTRDGCRSKARKGADRRRGDAASAKATAAKKRVASLWNTIGPAYGHPQVTYQKI